MNYQIVAMNTHVLVIEAETESEARGIAHDEMRDMDRGDGKITILSVEEVG